MPRRTSPIARIRLARSLRRLLAWPAIVIGTGAMAVASWFLGSFGSGAGGVLFAAVGGVLIVFGLALGAVLLSVRLEIHDAAVRLSWIGGERVYPLVRGPVTRVRLLGEGASSLQPRIGFFGWSIGGARLRHDEEISIVRLAATPTAILVPTELGRLAIAAKDEDELLEALSRAARARQRLEELADAAAAATSTETEPVSTAPTTVAPAEPVDAAQADVESRVLTGIERALLEQRLAEERAAAEASAAAVAASSAGDVIEADEEAAEPPRETSRRAVARRPRASVALAILPLIGSAGAWAVGFASGTVPDPGSDAGRLTTLALVLAGPATSVGAIMALVWWPRLVGIVVSGGLIAAAFLARGLMS